MVENETNDLLNYKMVENIYQNDTEMEDQTDRIMVEIDNVMGIAVDIENVVVN